MAQSATDVAAGPTALVSGSAAGWMIGKEVASSMTKSAVGDLPIVGDLAARVGGQLGAATGAAIGATVAGAALNAPQCVVDALCARRSPSPHSPRGGGRPLSNPPSHRARNVPTPVKPTNIESPLEQAADRTSTRTGRSTSPRFTDDQNHQIQEIAENNKRLMYQIGTMQTKQHQEMQNAMRILDDTTSQLDMVKGQMLKMQDQHEEAIERVRSQSRSRSRTPGPPIHKAVTFEDEDLEFHSPDNRLPTVASSSSGPQ